MHLHCSVVYSSAAEDLQEGVQEVDETFEARLKGLKQQAAQRSLVSSHRLYSCLSLLVPD